jgi:hypothetical protein
MPSRRVFDELVRADARPSRHAESRFAFYNRAAGPVFDRIRDCVERWFQSYPPDGRADIRARLRSKSDDVFSGAFWELYQHETLTAMGFDVVPHPALASSSRRPDFLVRRPNGRGFYLESTITSPSREDRASNRHLGTIYDLLNDLPSPNFFLDVEVDRRGPRPASTKAIRRDLVAWLETLDPDDVEATSGGWIRQEPLRWDAEGWSIRFRAIPKSPGHRGRPGRAIGVSMDQPVRAVDTSSGLRGAIKEKAGRYGRLDRPYVIAILIEDQFVHGEDLVDALYGTVSYRINTSPDADPDPQPFRQLDGPWMSPNGPTNTRVSAVMTASNLSPPLIARIAPQVWHNPWAAQPMKDRLAWRSSQVQDGGLLVASEAETEPSELLRLPAEWPGPEQAFLNE